jgi:phosphatidylserine synthase
MLAMISMVFRLSKKNINSHNQYLDYFFGGVLLFVAFVTLLFTKLRLAYQKKQNYLYFSVTLLFCFAFLTENILVHNTAFTILCDILLLGTIVPNKSHNTNKIKKKG